MEKKIGTKSKKQILLIVSILVVILIGGIFAYLTDTEELTNVFTLGDVSIDLQESEWYAIDETTGLTKYDEDGNPILKDGTDVDTNGIPDFAENIVANQEIAKDPLVLNTGINDAYVYLKVTVPVANVTVEGAEQAEKTQLFTYTVGEDWTEIETLRTETETANTYYYYYTNDTTSNALAVDAKTGNLFEKVKFANITDLSELTLQEDADIADYEIDIEAFAIQSNNLPEGTTVLTTEWVTAWTAEKNNG